MKTAAIDRNILRLLVVAATVPVLVVLLGLGCSQKQDQPTSSSGEYYTGPMKKKGGPMGGGAPTNDK